MAPNRRVGPPFFPPLSFPFFFPRGRRSSEVFYFRPRGIASASVVRPLGRPPRFPWSFSFLIRSTGFGSLSPTSADVGDPGAGMRLLSHPHLPIIKPFPATVLDAPGVFCVDRSLLLSFSRVLFREGERLRGPFLRPPPRLPLFSRQTRDRAVFFFFFLNFSFRRVTALPFHWGEVSSKCFPLLFIGRCRTKNLPPAELRPQARSFPPPFPSQTPRSKTFDYAAFFEEVEKCPPPPDVPSPDTLGQSRHPSTRSRYSPLPRPS